MSEETKKVRKPRITRDESQALALSAIIAYANGRKFEMTRLTSHSIRKGTWTAELTIDGKTRALLVEYEAKKVWEMTPTTVKLG
jgi:hypothetical protein